MAFQLSPGVLVTERDLTSVVPSVASTIGAVVIDAQWGPVDEITTIESENVLVSRFFNPDSTNYESWFTAASFLAYGSNLKVIRSVDVDTAKNAGSTAGVLIKNEDHYENNFSSGEGNNGMWAARYPGVIGNTLKVSFADSSNFDTNSVASATVSSVRFLFSKNFLSPRVSLGFAYRFAPLSSLCCKDLSILVSIVVSSSSFSNCKFFV